MKSSEQTRFNTLSKRPYDCRPDQLTTEQLESHFSELVESHSLRRL
jgi:hypothetical protein